MKNVIAIIKNAWGDSLPPTLPYPIHFLSSLPEVGGGLLGTEHGNISIPTGKSCSANWKNVTSHGDLTSTGIILSREC